MKKLFALFLLFFMVPTVSWAEDDSCSYPKDFTIDKRCYVRDNEKWLYPYNSVVAVETPSGYCTGTIIHQVKNQETADKFLYTAKHCVVDDNGIVSDKLNIVTQSGTRITADKYRVGDYDSINDVNFNGDWAVYKIPEEYEYIYSTTFSDKTKAGLNIPYSARVIGYGALKIMSDAEIEKFKGLYYSYLTGIEHVHTDVTEPALGWRKGDVDLTNKYVINFLGYLADRDGAYYEYVFGDNYKLKVSKCRYYASGIEKKCQVWGGNSGGGVFDNEGNLMGIQTRGKRQIGGKEHASLNRSRTNNINLLTPWRYDYETADMQGPLIQTEKIR
ncbi:MAG: hypothetical protein J6Y49_00460 [Alphaproteobacteria bacterium]|nr:hypothetical protein [Alphaproteobacteria bacterium]